jgi:Fe-S-cluster-containing hydrogenase component 2
MVCPFGVIQPVPSLKVAIKCDRCRNMGYPICAEVCPTQALTLEERIDYRKKAF